MARRGTWVAAGFLAAVVAGAGIGTAAEPPPAEKAVLAAEADGSKLLEAKKAVTEAITAEPKAVWPRILEARLLLLEAKAAKQAERAAAFDLVMKALDNAASKDLWDPAPWVFRRDVHQAMGNPDHGALEETLRRWAIRVPGDEVARAAYLRQAGKVPAVTKGDPLPRVKWKGADGADVPSETLWEKGPVIIELYRSAVWCNYCGKQIQSLNDAIPQFDAEGITIVAASPDTPETLAKIAKDGTFKGKPFKMRLLSDPKGDTADKLGFLNPETVKKGVPADQFGLPFPTTIIVDNRGVIRFVKTHLDYKVRVKPEEMLAIAKQIRVELTPDK